MVTKLFSSVPVNFNNREIARFHHWMTSFEGHLHVNLKKKSLSCSFRPTLPHFGQVPLILLKVFIFCWKCRKFRQLSWNPPKTNTNKIHMLLLRKLKINDLELFNCINSLLKEKGSLYNEAALTAVDRVRCSHSCQLVHLTWIHYLAQIMYTVHYQHVQNHQEHLKRGRFLKALVFTFEIFYNKISLAFFFWEESLFDVGSIPGMEVVCTKKKIPWMKKTQYSPSILLLYQWTIWFYLWQS